MVNKTNFTITGGKEIARVLQEMPRQYQRRALVQAFTAGAKVVAEEVKNQGRSKGVPVGLIDDLVVFRPTARQRYNRGQKYTVTAIGFKTENRRSRLAHLFEFGTADRYGQDGHFTGRITATPFLRPGLDASAAASSEIIAKMSAENIEIIIRQLTSGQKVSLAKKNRIL